jgi:hypothetical protein
MKFITGIVFCLLTSTAVLAVPPDFVVIGGKNIGQDVAANVRQNGVNQAAAVPEPGTFALIGLGLAGLAFSRRSRKR